MKLQRPRGRRPYKDRQTQRELHRIITEDVKDGIWRAELREPLATNMPLQEQLDHLLEHAHLAECNNSFAQMHGYSRPEDIVGKRMQTFLDLSDPRNVKIVRAFISSSYEIHDAETRTIDRNGVPRHFVNTAVGIVKRGYLKGIWGVQRDATGRRLSNQATKRMLAILTPREREILKLTTAQFTIKEIADVLHISAKTVDTHRMRLMKRLSIHDQVGLTLLAVQLGIAEKEPSRS